MWSTLSPEAQKARDEATIRYREQNRLSDKMRAGPYYDAERSELRIPAYFWNDVISPIAAAEWRKHKMFFARSAREWAFPVDSRCAIDQVAKARAVFDALWHIQREEDNVR